MKIAVACDHGGYRLKNVLMKYQVGMIVEKQNIDFIEFDDEREQEKNSIGYKIEELEKMIDEFRQ